MPYAITIQLHSVYYPMRIHPV